MFSNKDVTKVYETMLKSSWMKEEVKVVLKLSRRDILLLNQIIEKGLASEDTKQFIPEEAAGSIREIAAGMLAKAELTDIKDVAVPKS